MYLLFRRKKIDAHMAQWTLLRTYKAIFTWGSATSYVNELVISLRIVDEQFEIVKKILSGHI